MSKIKISLNFRSIPNFKYFSRPNRTRYSQTVFFILSSVFLLLIYTRVEKYNYYQKFKKVDRWRSDMSKIGILAKYVRREDVYIVARLHLSSRWCSVPATH